MVFAHTVTLLRRSLLKRRARCWKERDQEIARAKLQLSGEDQRRPKERERRPTGHNLMPVQPRAGLSKQERHDRAEPDGVDQPSESEPGEVRLAIAAIQETSIGSQPDRNSSLQDGSVELAGRCLGLGKELGHN